MAKLKYDLTNKRFGKLVVLKRVENTKSYRATYWLCKCDCGGETITNTSCLIKGKSKSCGCLNKQIVKEMKTIHGMSQSKLYGTWNTMRERCVNPNVKSYKNYGGIGITVCDDWFQFKNFAEWSLNNGYKEGLTLDRINVEGNYEPNNCRWVTMKVQNNNRGNNHYLIYKNKKYTLMQLSEAYNINYCTLKRRLYNGWSIERSVETPVRHSKKAVN